jgi:hypothetical protein
MPGRIVTLCLYPMLAAALVSGVSLGQPVTPVPPPADRKPTAAPTTPTAAEPHDLTTPKGALKVLASALRDGDAGRIREVMYATTPAESRMVAAMADMAAAMAQLQKAAVKAFGEEGAKEIVGDTQATDAQGRARIDAAEVRLAGDTATVIVPEGEDAPVVLKRVNGQWKVPMSELSKNADPSALEERLTELGEQRKLVAQLTDEIGQGQFKNPAQAKDAWQSRAMQAVTRRPPPRKAQPEGAKPSEAAPNAADASARPASGQ